MYGEIRAAVDTAIREFAILDRQFSADENELTPILKLRRNVIEEHVSDEIESIYAR